MGFRAEGKPTTPPVRVCVCVCAGDLGLGFRYVCVGADESACVHAQKSLHSDFI